MGYDDRQDSINLQPLNSYGYSKVLFDRWALEQVKARQKMDWRKVF